MVDSKNISKDKYMNFPIWFLKDFMISPDDSLTMILAYNIYEKVYSENRCFESIKHFITISEVETGNLDLDELVKLGKTLHSNNISSEIKKGKKYPMTGIKTDLFNDFFMIKKGHFDLICLLAYLAIRSIIQKSEYRNIKDSLLLSRMAGYAGIGHPIADEITHWMVLSRYRRTKVLNCLRDRYKMKTAYKARGITCSFSLSQEELEYSIQLAKIKKGKKGVSERKKAKEKVLDKIKNYNNIST